MEWIATGVATVAALVAGWQAWEARRARIDARSSAGEAQQHEERAAAASERIATAIEEQNALERTERERYKNPWTMHRGSDQHTRWYTFVLGGDESVAEVEIAADEEDSARELHGLEAEDDDDASRRIAHLDVDAVHGLGISGHGGTALDAPERRRAQHRGHSQLEFDAYSPATTARCDVSRFRCSRSAFSIICSPRSSCSIANASAPFISRRRRRVCTSRIITTSRSSATT